MLDNKFFQNNTVDVAENLLGKILYVKNNGNLFSGYINETEAYCGFEDDACHGSRGMTKRNEVMFGEASFVYIYFTYGLHYMLNIVTESVGVPTAVLIRSLIPLCGIEHMAINRYKKPLIELTNSQKENLANGPAKLTKAIGIDIRFLGLSLTKLGDPSIWIEEGYVINESNITKSKRIGIEYAVKSRDNLWNFKIPPSTFKI